jgi:excisionase family DNA binding protein
MLDIKMIKRYLSPKELSEYLGISIQTIYEWTSQRRIPFVKLSRLVKFDITAIDDWMKSQREEPCKH